MCRAAYLARLVVVFSALALNIFHMKAQSPVAPGGVQGSALWSRHGDSSDFFANYHSINLLKLRQQADSNIPPMQGATTLFLVLKPNFTTSNGAQFMELGDIVLYDNQLTHVTSTTAQDFSDGQPKILTLSMQRSPRFKTSIIPELHIVDSTLFSVAELIYYPRLNNRADIKKVNSYLALKYSVPITGVTDMNWRDYWAEDSSRYWDFNTDKMYDLRVLGLGRSSDEDFYQSQTLASNGSYIRLSLNGAMPQGEMPSVAINEDAFLIMSERVPESLSSYLNCMNDGSNPLGNWKLKPHQWGSAALYLYISVDPPSKGSVSDSIWLTDGLTYIWVPQISSTAKVTFQVPLASVQSGMHYFFTDVKGDPCDEVVIGTTDQILTIDNFTDLGGLTARIMNYQSGLMIDEPLTNHLERPIERGQYQVWVLDPDGKVLAERVVRDGGSALPKDPRLLPSLKLLPNPIPAGGATQLVIENLPSESPLGIYLYDAVGQLIASKTSNYQNGMAVQLSAPTAGLYTVTVLQDKVSYSQKLLVVGQ